MRKTVVLNVAGLMPSLLGESMPNLTRWICEGCAMPVRPAMPAVSGCVQATYLTGRHPDEHGIVGDGWYQRRERRVRFGRHSGRMVRGRTVWETARMIDSEFTCADIFGRFGIYSTADYVVAPWSARRADGRPIADPYTVPAGLRDDLHGWCGQFPLADLWGPGASIRSSRWIADAARHVERAHGPTLTLVNLPHLDYFLQRLGPRDPALRGEQKEIDAICGELIEFYESRGAQVIVLSEYGVNEVSTPVHLNRLLRSHGLLTARSERGREMLDTESSAAFAVADHQIAHVYVNDSRRKEEVRRLLESADGVETVLADREKRACRLDHEHSGDFVAIARSDAWFTYYYWTDDGRAPDFARAVEPHRKPGHDPAELFIDPALRMPTLKLAWTLLKKKLGLRWRLDVVPLDATLVRGSHGRPGDDPINGPLVATRRSDLLEERVVDATAIYRLILEHLFTEGTAQPGSVPGLRRVDPHQRNAP
jgi:predicted AlkP superfamily pyrophosphatase or phosphodiesterase